MNDLIVLVADKDAEMAIRELLGRADALKIRTIRFEIIRSSDHDPGVVRQAVSLLRLYLKRSRHALVLLDRTGSGRDSDSRECIERSLELELKQNGWQGRCAAIVIDPELEIWVWSDSPEVDRALGWTGRTPDLRTWLQNAHLLAHNDAKPGNPKEAMTRALREAQRPRSSALFSQLAGKVSIRRCTDPAFAKLRRTLHEWFPLEND